MIFFNPDLPQESTFKTFLEIAAYIIQNLTFFKGPDKTLLHHTGDLICSGSAGNINS